MSERMQVETQDSDYFSSGQGYVIEGRRFRSFAAASRYLQSVCFMDPSEASHYLGSLASRKS